MRRSRMHTITVHPDGLEGGGFPSPKDGKTAPRCPLFPMVTAAVVTIVLFNVGFGTIATSPESRLEILPEDQQRGGGTDFLEASWTSVDEGIPSRDFPLEGDVIKGVGKFYASRTGKAMVTAEESQRSAAKPDEMANEPYLSKGVNSTNPNSGAVVSRVSEQGGVAVPGPRGGPIRCEMVVEGLPLVFPFHQVCCAEPSVLSQVPKRRNPNTAGQEGVLGKGEGIAGWRNLLESEAQGGVGEKAVLEAEVPQGWGERSKKVMCLPSFIIGGTQKSGTTALTAILEQHPSVRMSVRKELHFFDTPAKVKRGLEMYARQFPSMNASQALEHSAPFVVGEATPFYLASRKACETMSKLVPNVRLIVLLREPVKRLYSEYAMKVRRVNDQNEMLELAKKEANKMYSCFMKVLPSTAEEITASRANMLKSPALLTKALTACAGEIGQHPKWQDLLYGFHYRLGQKHKNAAQGKKQFPPADVLKVLKEDVSACFPLQHLVDEAKRKFPSGDWRAGWNKHQPMTNAAARAQHGQQGAAGSGESEGGTIISEKPKVQAGPRKLVGSQEHTESVLPVNPVDNKGEEWNSTLWGGFKHAVSPALGEVDMEKGLVGRGDHLWRAGVMGERSIKGEPLTLGLGHRLLVDDGEGGKPQGGRAEAEGIKQNLMGVVNRKDAQEQGGEEVGGVQDKTPGSGPPKVDSMDWGEWGEEGLRTYDTTCYMRTEFKPRIVESLRKEMLVLNKCFHRALEPLGGEEVMNASHTDMVKKVLPVLDHAIDSCMKVHPGIGDQYLYRSLYSIQLFHCLKHIPRDQLLVIESDDLRENGDTVMERIHKFIGVPSYTYKSLDKTAIRDQLKIKYPEFERRTGWRLDSKYDEQLPQDLIKEINEFFRPHIGMLRSLLGQDLGPWAM
ncbi:unnamed protein product [Discosporangium mesarthrocarpum]